MNHWLTYDSGTGDGDGTHFRTEWSLDGACDGYGELEDCDYTRTADLEISVYGGEYNRGNGYLSGMAGDDSLASRGSGVSDPLLIYGNPVLIMPLMIPDDFEASIQLAQLTIHKEPR